MRDLDLDKLQSIFTCGFAHPQEIFETSMKDAARFLSSEGLESYAKAANTICQMGRGEEPVLVFLQEAPLVAAILGEEVISEVVEFIWVINRSPNANSIVPFIQSLPAVVRSLEDKVLFEQYLKLVKQVMDATEGSVHGFHAIYPSPGLPYFLEIMPRLLEELTLDGIENWVDYGVKNFSNHPDRQIEFFKLETADSKAILKRERHGTLFVNIESLLEKYIKALWNEDFFFKPYSPNYNETHKLIPYMDELGMHLPDVMDDLDENTSGLDRYLALASHMCAHKLFGEWSFADNFAPFQRVSIEMMEDCRVEWIAMKRYPGLRKLWQKLHPVPDQDACDDENQSCILHRLTMFSRAVLDPDYLIKDPVLQGFVKEFHEIMEAGNSTIKDSIRLGVSLVVKTRRHSDSFPDVFFENTSVSYRDDNRHMWKFHEENDEAEDFEDNRASVDEDEDEDIHGLPHHYDEWDYSSETYRPDWVTLYENLHPSEDYRTIDALLEKHKNLIKQLKMIIEKLKPQNYVRVRYQEEGAELDLDVAIKSLIDFKSGHNPDPRINMDHKHDGRDLSVMILLDLSQSINETVPGSDQTILQLSQEAVSILSWAIQQLGDGFSIAGFHSDTRHQVRYYAIKGFSESWDDTVKARLAAMKAGLSTRMGAAMRHAAHYIKHQQSDKKLMLILTDGEPADVDMSDPELLIQDARMAKVELEQNDIYSYCINLDPHADDYVEKIFGNHYTIIDNIERLPEKLAEVFIQLTG